MPQFTAPPPVVAERKEELEAVRARSRETLARLGPPLRLRGAVRTYFDEELSPQGCTMFLGRNTAGKTSRLLGVRYAVLGTSGWSLGQHGASNAQLAPIGADVMFSELIWSSGKLRFEITKVGSKWSQPHDPIPTGDLAYVTAEDRTRLLPSVTLAEVLDYGTERARRAIAKRWGPAAFPSPKGLLPEQRAVWDDVKTDVEKELGSDATAMEVLSDMEKRFLGLQKSAGSKVKAFEVEKSKEADLEEAMAGVEQIPVLRAQLDRAHEWERAASSRAELEKIAAAEAELELAEASYTAAVQSAKHVHPAPVDEGRAALDAALLGAQAQLSTAQTAASAALATPDGLRFVAAQFTAQQTDNCPFCTSRVDIKALAAHYNATIAQWEAAVVGHRNAVSAANQAVGQAQLAIQTHAQAFTQKLRAHEQAIAQKDSALRAEYTRLREVRAGLTARRAAAVAASPAVPYTGPSSADLEAEIQALEEAEKAYLALEANLIALNQARNEAALYKILKDGAADCLKRVTRGVIDTATGEVQARMPEGKIVGLDLETAAWTVENRVGGESNRHQRCGYESAALSAAFFTAYAPGGIILLDDDELKGVGDENVEPFFRAIFEARARGDIMAAIVAANRMHQHADLLRSIGWKVIEVNPDQPTQRPGRSLR